MSNQWDETVKYPVLGADEDVTPVRRILTEVASALAEKGYNPVNQLVGYLLSGDPTYITSHKNARNLIRKVERDEIIEELVKSYMLK
ncbi:MAG: IreB family regulatory phosphoprotein [Clostridia bacterium]|nr:IreB family regulatory phosphoprotein [Clostridia bacterium]